MNVHHVHILITLSRVHLDNWQMPPINWTEQGPSQEHSMMHWLILLPVMLIKILLFAPRGLLLINISTRGRERSKEIRTDLPWTIHLLLNQQIACIVPCTMAIEHLQYTVWSWCDLSFKCMSIALKWRTDSRSFDRFASLLGTTVLGPPSALVFLQWLNFLFPFTKGACHFPLASYCAPANYWDTRTYSSCVLIHQNLL